MYVLRRGQDVQLELLPPIWHHEGGDHFSILVILDQVYNFLLDDPIHTRIYLVTEIKKCLMKGGVDPEFFCSYFPIPELYFKKMIKIGEWCENIMTFFSFIIKRDFRIYKVTLVSGIISMVGWQGCFLF